jgi:hypothetical protein
MTVQQTLKTWTVAETIIGVAGLGFTLLLSLIVGCASYGRGRELLDAEGKRNVHKSDYGFLAVEHDRRELQPRKRVADCSSELCVTEGFDNAGPGDHATHGVDGEPRSDESGTALQLQVGGIVECSTAGNDMLQRRVGNNRQAVGPDRREVVGATWLWNRQVGHDWDFLPATPCARDGNQGQQDRGPFQGKEPPTKGEPSPARFASSTA